MSSEVEINMDEQSNYSTTLEKWKSARANSRKTMRSFLRSLLVYLTVPSSNSPDFGKYVPVLRPLENILRIMVGLTWTYVLAPPPYQRIFKKNGCIIHARDAFRRKPPISFCLLRNACFFKVVNLEARIAHCCRMANESNDHALE